MIIMVVDDPKKIQWYFMSCATSLPRLPTEVEVRE